MKNYFNDCRTIEQVKATYKKLAKILHPDCGGDGEEFKRMHDQYEAAFNRCKNCHESQDGKTYYKESNETPEMFADIIDKLVNMPGLTIEICGCWIWISGDTMSNKEGLKAAGCKWASKKKMWYWHTPESGKAGKSTMSMEKIRAKYGSQVVESKQEKVLRLA